MPGKVRTRALLVPQVVLESLQTARSTSLPKETGGYLIGLRRGPYLEVTAATFQAPEDIATGSSFERIDPSHARVALEAWRSDGGLSTIVGDWHSHPSGAGQPSSTDLVAWRKLARAEKAAIAGLVLGDGAMTAHLTIASWSTARTEELVLIESTDADVIFCPAAGERAFESGRNISSDDLG